MERKSVIQAIAHWAKHEPQRTAVIDGDVRTSFAQFWDRVQSVAAALHRLGCGREDCVAVYIDRSTDAVVAIYAALACGSAYVPVDPTAGRQRIAYILENCKAKVVLTAGLSPQTQIPTVDVRNVPTASFSPAERQPDDLAYVIYTSGTTGMPKGVMIEEHSMLNHLDTLYEHYGCRLGQTVPFMTSHCFDFSIPIVFSLYFGMTLLLCPDVFAVGAYLEHERLDFLRMTPSHFMAAADMLKRNACGKVDHMIFGGEALTDAMCDKVREVFGEQVRIYNEYGPTELTVYTTFMELHKGQITGIGRPCAGSSVYILDGERLCAPNEIGELCFAGPNVARGYFADSEKTADRFRMFNGVRLYHTGDLGYMDEDGILYYAGRRDKQIKIRGFRVEPEEISGVLRKQKFVTDAVVIAVKAANGEQEIHAYLVADQALNLEEIAQRIREDLPSYMIPSAMLQIPQIPLTANGKLDERALPEIQKKRSHTPPRNQTEATFCALFGEFLRYDEIGIDEDFFAMGGNSLAAMGLLNRLAEEGYRLTLTDIFTHPTVQELAPVLARQEKKAPIPPAPVQKDYPLSPSQEQMYWFYRLDPESLSYHMPWLLQLEEGVTPEDIRSAMQSMVDRHEILRTRFIDRDGAARQEVLPQLTVTIQVIEEETALNNDILQNFLRPFVLEQPPLFRFTMLKQATGWLLLTDMHHIIRDGLSCGIFLEEYAALRAANILPVPQLQYKDYCAWVQNRNLSARGAFWQEQFRVLPEPLALPTDYPRPAVRSYAGACVEQTVPETLKLALRRLEKQTGTTDYMIFLAAAMILMGQYARQEDVVIGSPLAGRAHEDLSQMLGIFINTLPLRAYPEGHKTLEEFLREIRSLCLGAYAHQEYPLAKLVEACGATRESSRNPLYDVILVLQNNEHMDFSMGGKQVHRLPLHQGMSKVDLTFQILESRDRFNIILEYSTELFCAESAKRILEHYLTLLERMAEGLSLTLRELLPLSASAREKLIDQPIVFEANPKNVAELFAAQAALHPEKIAVRDGLRQWSYGQLQDKASRLAGRLQALGLTSGDFAVVLCERSAEYLLAVLAVLHCGAAFVPIDPEYPEERIQFILQDSEAVLVLTDGAVSDYSVPAVHLTEEIHDAPVALVKAAAESPAYMIYTSGTTGKPKGVMIPNRALAHYMAYASKHYCDSTLEVALFSSVSFDLTVTSTFLGLLNGGTTTVYRQSPDIALGQILAENRTTFLKLTPSHLKMMEEMPCPTDCTLRHMVLGGEVLSTSLAHRAQLRYGSQLVIHNEYGPTEATVGCCDYCYDALRDTEASVSIGTPMPHAQIYILRDDQLCPIGIPGEICIAGAGVALGYKNRPELTAKVFVPNPFGEGLLYRTGDLARWRADGRLEFMGRIDEQVKIRGYRIEPEEVQKVLSSAAGVQAALVVADREEEILCGYVVSELTLDTQAIVRALSETLPSYMLPQFIMQIPAIPLTVNGKVDKAALPRPKRTHTYRTAESAEETLLCEVVAELLGLEHVSPEEDFFALGGNSLKLMTLRLRLEGRTGRAISLTELYREPKLESIARHLAHSPKAERPIAPAKKQESYPMSAVQERLFAIYLAEPENLAYNHPMGIDIRGELDASRLETAFRQLIARHEALRTRFDGKRQWIDETVSFTLTQKSCPDADAQKLLAEFARPFRLEQAPLLRAELVELGQEHWLLLTDVHHIAADGISKSILSEELTALYNAQPLAPVSLQYKDYSQWITEHAHSGESEFWAQMCAGEPTELIYDKTSTKHRTAREAVRSLSEAQSQALRKLCLSRGVTPYMFFLAAWSRVLSVYARSEDVTVGTSFAGRTQANLEQTVGMFVHTLLLRSHPSGEKSFHDYLQEIKALCTEAQIHQEESETALREALATCKLFYAFEDVPPMDFAFAGTTCTVVEPETVELPFDMTFLVEDRSCYRLCLQYCTELFCEYTAESMLEHLLALVSYVLKTPSCQLQEIPLLTAQEQKLLTAFNRTEAEFDRNITIADRFEAIAAQYAEKTAVIFEAQSFSYSDFNAQANGIAHELQARGIGIGDRVALICKNSVQRMLAVWGSVKSGAAYVPIEPDFPIERIKSILADCQPRCLLVFGAEIQTELPVLELSELPAPRYDNPVRRQKQTDPLYCIYTSGTTGTPKGVLLSNRGLVNLVNYYDRRLGFTDRDRVLQFASYCFDASVSEMLMALAFGGTLILASDDLRHDSRRLSEYCRFEQVTVATFPPNLYAQIEPFPARLILTAGSAADPDTVRHGSEKGAYMNAYGPTEASICATDWLYDGNSEIPQRVPIGKPIDNVKIHILQGTRPCGIGIPGELCISGESLALEYLNRPALTAEKFTQIGTDRVYRTGDLARWLPDGNLDYLGRCDEQVKLRGFRIELQEIASCLCTLDGIEVATVRLLKLKSETLCAYYVSQKPYTDEEIRAHLAKQLPDYMIPEAYVALQELPVNTSGKIDTKRLPLPQLGKDAPYLPPQTPAQEILCTLFEDLLQVRPVGREDDFFRLGGQSLKAMLLMNSVEERFGHRPTFAEILQNPTPCQLERLLHQVTQSYEPIPYAPEASAYPASAVQARFYSIQKAQPDSVAYNVPFCLKLEGNRSRLAEVLNEVFAAHEAFRTAFCVENGQVVQKLFPFTPISIAERDLGENETLSDAMGDFVRPFRLEQAPLVRACIVRRKGEAWLLLDMHHSIVDGASTAVLSRHFQAVYDGKQIEPPRQYHDYSLWDARQDRSVQKAFWEHALSGELPQVLLPYEKTQLPPTGALCKKRLSPELTHAIATLSQETGCTEYMLLLSAVMVVLSRYSSSEDVTVGTPVANRMHKDTAQMVGMFVNTLLMRAYPKADLTFAEFLAQVKEFTVKALEYQDYPFDAVVDYLRKNGAYEESSFLPVMFSMQEQGKLSFGGKDFRAEALEESNGEGKFDLSIDVLTEKEGYVFSMDYRAHKLSEISVTRFFSHVEQVLQTVTAKPQTKLGELDILSAEERSRILDIFNHTVTHPTVSFLELFDRQAERTPHSLAVVHRDRRLTYAQLDALSDRLAWSLREMGVQNGQAVAIFSSFDEDMFVGALGIMKAGCAYVPVDPKYPKQRIAYMLNDCGAHCVVCSQGLDVSCDVPKIIIQKEARDVTPFPAEYDAQALAYVIYTSGSTGQPKGVMVSQGALGNMVQWHNRYYQIKEGDRSCKYASFSFDASVHEMYPQLAAGAEIHIIAEDIRMDMFAINRYLTDNRINIGFLPTPICEQFVKLENHSLEKLIAGGDRMTRHSRNYTLYNNYGPTENTVVSTVYEVQGHESIIPIGKPIDGTRVYVLSKEGQLQPIGVTGELALAGRSLAKGYLHKPELTAQRFVDDPFFPGEKMYLTGDTGRWTESGDLLYEGRIDDQYKIRGNRVEIGEIETAAQALASQARARVLDGRLVLYVEGDVQESVLREHLRQSLPEYMLPEAYVFVEKLLYTVNSKPDFDAMPAPQFAKTSREFVPIEDAVESEIAQIWKQTLETEEVGRFDNFFELGGNSLRITLLHYAIEKAYPNQLTVGDLFANPTVATMAQALRRKLAVKVSRKPCLLSLQEGRGGSVSATAPTVKESVYLAALAYTLMRCGKCREAVIYLEAEPKLLRCYQFDMQALETAAQLLSAAEEQGGAPLISLGDREDHAEKRAFTVLLSPYGNHRELDLVFCTADGKLSLHENSGRVAKTALEQLAQVFCKSCELFAQVERPNRYPLSPQQSRIYIAQSVLAEKNAYHIPMAFCLPVHTDVDRLCHALNALVKRYDIFRTSFHLEDGQLWQKVAREVRFAPQIRQLSDFDPQSFTIGEAFDLTQAPLLRAEIIKTPQAVYLLLETHHIIFDGASLDILRREFVKLYQGESLPLVTLQYPETCLWKKDLQASQEYWREHFAQGAITLELPTDKVRSQSRSYRCGVQTLEIEAELFSRLRRLAAQLGATEFALFTAAAHLLFSRYCGQKHTVLGTAMSGRTQSRLQNVPGMFVNTVALTAHVQPEESFAAFLKQVSQSIAEAEEHQSYPFADLIGLLGLESDGSRTPLIDVSIGFEEVTDSNQIDLPSEIEKFDMSIRCMRTECSARLELSYCLDLFCGETARRLLDSFLAILQELRPDALLRELTALSEGQRQYLDALNQTDADDPQNLTVCDMLERFAHSGKTAVVFGERSLSYRELLEQSRNIAGLLQKNSLQKEEIVGVFLPRGLEMYPVILGILLAGGAYLPMDPAYPDERLQYMAQDSGMRYVFTTRELAPRLQGCCEAVYVDELPSAPYAAVKIQSKQLAYVIYTSGSSGKPKGVLVEHGSLANMVLWHQRRFGNCEKDVSTQYAGLGFDATVWEIFPYLAVGATIHVIPESLRLDMEALNAYYEANGVTVSYLPTQICEQFMKLDNHSLRILHTAGDKLKHFQKRSYRLMNNYGPTENTVVATTAELTEDSWNLPIGLPMDNCKVYVLDADGILLPPGARGELCLTGRSVARGYLHRPEEQKFISNPFGAGQMYKTGDLVRWNVSGELEFLGRTDNQVKIRGNRIECGEIEAVLAKLPQITQCAVTVQTRGNENYLAAYVCSEESLSLSAIKAELSKKLPQYMVPSVLMQLPALPLTPNGKLDRAALPQKEQAQESTALPTTQLQKELAGLWQELLQGDEPCIDQSFFSLGGTSVLMISLQRGIQERFGQRLSIAELFANPTIEKQELLLQHSQTLTFKGVTLNLPMGRSRVLPLSPRCAKALWQMGEKKAFHVGLTAFGYVLCALSKQTRVPIQGRSKAELFAAELDFAGIGQFGQALERVEQTQLHTLALQKQALRIEKQPGQRVPIFVWNDAAHNPADDRADTVLRLCISATEASLRTDHPKDSAIAAAIAQILEKLSN